MAPQTLPQPPQLALFVASLTSHPFADWPSQLAVPAGQTHLPATQVWSKLHSAPQAPQLAGSTAESTSQPVTTFLSQSRWPNKHVFVQLLALQLVPGQPLPHDPQFAGSLSVLTQTPLQRV